jgi:CBS domain-containing protein
VLNPEISSTPLPARAGRGGQAACGVDVTGRLVGIISRRDLPRVYLREADRENHEILDEITGQIMRRTRPLSLDGLM